ncbi:MAG: 30S ribosomal protein S20 [Alphaproteobacteria bacterium]|jgi:small subunit ribosomal protein S20|nr:30S ribosomal protein S20 [Alphaproteobacteria bacterium]
MATHKSAEKKIRQIKVRTERNRQHMSRMRTFVKRVEMAIKDGKKEEAQAAFREAESVIAKTAQKGVIPAQRASRKTSRLAAAIKKLA